MELPWSTSPSTTSPFSLSRTSDLGQSCRQQVGTWCGKKSPKHGNVTESLLVVTVVLNAISRPSRYSRNCSMSPPRRQVLWKPKPPTLQGPMRIGTDTGTILAVRYQDLVLADLLAPSTMGWYCSLGSVNSISLRAPYQLLSWY